MMLLLASVVVSRAVEPVTFHPPELPDATFEPFPKALLQEQPKAPLERYR